MEIKKNTLYPAFNCLLKRVSKFLLTPGKNTLYKYEHVYVFIDSDYQTLR